MKRQNRNSIRSVVLSRSRRQHLWLDRVWSGPVRWLIADFLVSF